LGERMQFGAAGSTVHGPVTVKNCALVKPTIMIRKTPHVPVMRGRPGDTERTFWGARARVRAPSIAGKKVLRPGDGLITVARLAAVGLSGCRESTSEREMGQHLGWGVGHARHSEQPAGVAPPAAPTALAARAAPAAPPQHPPQQGGPQIVGPPKRGSGRGSMHERRCTARLPWPHFRWLPRRCGSTSSTIAPAARAPHGGSSPRNRAVAHIS
jgi:hypothetical protein